MMESMSFLFLLFILFLSLSPPSTYQQSSSNNNKTASQPANTSKAAVNIHHEDRLQRWQKRLEKMEASQLTPSTFSADVCHCDLSPNHCDVDCCCDQRCHRLEKLAFSRCKSSVDISNDLEEQRTFCHSSAHIFGRKRLYLDRQSSRLLCIARTNSAKGELSYANRPTITDFSLSLSSLVLAYSKFKWSPAANSKTGNSFFTNSRASSSSSTADEDQVKAVLEYRTGAPVLVLTAAKKLTASPSGNGSTSSGEQWRLEQWRLPAALGGSQLCNHRALVGYMHDYQADCWRPFTTCKGEDENDDFSRLRFHYYDFVAGEYRPVKVEFEKGDKILKVTFDSAKGTCSGVIASRHFTVYHRGIYGISRVVLKVRHFPPISVTAAAAEVRQVKQHFAVHFRWEEDDAMMNATITTAANSNSTAAAAKSNGTIHSASSSSSSSFSLFGGYRRGQPLLFAQQLQQTSNESSSSVLPLEKSTLIITYRGGSCGGNGAGNEGILAQNPFRFGVNQLTSCRLQLRVPSMARKAICGRLEAAIAKVVPLLFDAGSSSGGGGGKNASTLLVSIFGNGTSTFNATSKEKDWLPVLVLPSTAAAVTDPEFSAAQLTALGCNESSPFSLGTTTATNWQVFYARVGPKASPKLKVVAVTVQSSGQPLGNYLEVSCPPPPQAATISKNTNNSAAALPLCSAVLDTELTAAVDFVDVTAGPAVPDYAPAPSVRFELPSDFFYPFTANSSSATISSRFIIIIHSLFIFSAILGGRMF